MPAFAAAPGIPHTTLEASSWAITLPPAATISLPPRMPSEPMPVRTTARTPPCQTSIAELNNGSTAGLQKLTGGPSSRAITTSQPWRATQSRSDGGVLLYVLVPGAGTLRAQADAGVRVRTASRARAGARRGRRALARSRAREQVATRLVAGALSAPQGGGVVALPLTLAAAYSALANGRGGLSASVTVTFSAPGRPTLSATLDVTFARRAGAAKHRAHSSRHRRHSRRRARHT